MKTVNRGWLRKQVDAGMIDAKCDYSLTDDYAYDAANNGGKTDWMPARIMRPQYVPYTDQCLDRDFISGVMNFRDSDFEGKSGLAYWESDTQISLIIHQNCSYTLRLRTTPIDAALRSKPIVAKIASKPSVMTLAPTRKRVKHNGFSVTVQGTGMVLYGTNEATGKWFERHFPSAEKAREYAMKQGWTIKGDEAPAPTPQPKPRIRLMPTVRQIA